MRRIARYFMLSLVAACGDPLNVPDAIECAGTGTVTVTVLGPGPGVPITGDLTLTGTAEHSDDLTIRNLSVLGVSAENVGFNFDSWRVTLPYSVLAANMSSETSADGREVALHVTVREACGGGVEDATHAEGSTRSVFVEPKVRLGTLRASITHASTAETKVSEPGYLAPTASATATLKLSSEPNAAAAKVLLEAPGVLFAGASDRTSVRLDNAGEAEVVLRSAHIGPTSITAHSGEDVVTAILLVGGRPVLSTGALTLTAGAAIPVHGRVEGDVPAGVTCEASATMYATVTSKYGALTQAGGVFFDLGAGAGIDFIIQASDGVKPEVFTVICTEKAYGQIGEPLVVTIQG